MSLPLRRVLLAVSLSSPAFAESPTAVEFKPEILEHLRPKKPAPAAECLPEERGGLPSGNPLNAPDWALPHLLLFHFDGTPQTVFRASPYMVRP